MSNIISLEAAGDTAAFSTCLCYLMPDYKDLQLFPSMNDWS